MPCCAAAKTPRTDQAPGTSSSRTGGRSAQRSTPKVKMTVGHGRPKVGVRGYACPPLLAPVVPSYRAPSRTSAITELARIRQQLRTHRRNQHVSRHPTRTVDIAYLTCHHVVARSEQRKSTFFRGFTDPNGINQTIMAKRSERIGTKRPRHIDRAPHPPNCLAILDEMASDLGLELAMLARQVFLAAATNISGRPLFTGRTPSHVVERRLAAM